MEMIQLISIEKNYLDAMILRIWNIGHVTCCMQSCRHLKQSMCDVCTYNTIMKRYIEPEINLSQTGARRTDGKSSFFSSQHPITTVQPQARSFPLTCPRWFAAWLVLRYTPSSLHAVVLRRVLGRLSLTHDQRHHYRHLHRHRHRHHRHHHRHRRHRHRHRSSVCPPM